MGYLLFGLSVVYGVSGIALNHIRDWKPSYIITNVSFTTTIDFEKENTDKDLVLDLLDELDENDNYKKHYFPQEDKLKVFLKGGNIELNTSSGKGQLEKIRKRPVFYEMNYLHYNPVVWWTYIADIYAGGLVILALTGLFLIRGKKGIKGRGAWLTAIGILIPILFLLIFK